MARKRMIDPNFWESIDVLKLTVRQKLLAIALFSLADDYGKGLAEPLHIKVKVFQLENISFEEIEEDLRQIEKHLSLVIYENGGRKYYKWLNWDKWQKVEKKTKSVMPDPTEEDIQRAGLTWSNTIVNKPVNKMLTPSATPEGRQVKRNNLTEPEALAPQGLGMVGEDSGNIRGGFGEDSGNVPLPFDLKRIEGNRREYEEKGIPFSEDSGNDIRKLLQQKLEAAGYTASPAYIQQVETLQKDFSEELIAEAIEIAFSRQRKPGVNYIRGILNSWKEKGLNTVDTVRQAEGRWTEDDEAVQELATYELRTYKPEDIPRPRPKPTEKRAPPGNGVVLAGELVNKLLKPP